MKNQTKMKFVFPNRDYEEKAKDFIREFDEYKSESNGSGGLERYLNQSTYEEWLKTTERGKGYATRMLEETLNFCGSIGLTELVLTCDRSNIASARVIQRCGGKLEAEFYSETFREIIQRYRILRQKKMTE